MADPVIIPNRSIAERAWQIRRNAVRMGQVQGQGYIAQALDISDVLAVAYFHAMRYRPTTRLGGAGPLPALERPLRHRALRGADRGRTSPRPNSNPTAATTAACRCRAWRNTPRMEMSGGSLGLGLSIAVGKALGLKRKGSPARVYTLFSDGDRARARSGRRSCRPPSSGSAT